jgi:inositol transport system permease protein
MTTTSESLAPPRVRRRKLPTELSILLVLVGIALTFELLGWIFVGQSFLMNQQRRWSASSPSA